MIHYNSLSHFETLCKYNWTAFSDLRWSPPFLFTQLPALDPRWAFPPQGGFQLLNGPARLVRLWLKPLLDRQTQRCTRGRYIHWSLNITYFIWCLKCHRSSWYIFYMYVPYSMRVYIYNYIIYIIQTNYINTAHHDHDLTTYCTIEIHRRLGTIWRNKDMQKSTAGGILHATCFWEPELQKRSPKQTSQEAANDLTQQTPRNCEEN